MKIAAFNVLRLGWNKVNKEDVRDIIIEIMSEYSVVLLLEVRTGGGHGTAPNTLMTMEITEGIHTACCAVNLWDRRVDRRSLSTSTERKKSWFDPGPHQTNGHRSGADALHDVVEDVRERWQNDNIMILGDFNADRPYLSNEKKETLSISSAPYHWLIDDDVNTMTSNNNKHAYDRIVVYGERMLEAIVPDSAKAYNFKEELNLTQEQVRLMFRGIVGTMR
ncbi:Deoxyribonuclease-1 [Dissostichus eleginoides]|uniref:Deoxyribonuclease-1 n=1 Tax=Dissostichus eleginoides TaxID=100907 RepID=A0AAD9CGS6_DISEL|nr:Deoxyribonuclease-1 [Dissostichus eleginoides]